MSQRLPVSADSDDALVASFRQIGLSVGNGFEWQTLDEPTRRGLARAAKAGEQIVDSKWAAAGETTNGWKYTFAGGRAGYDPGLRAALAKYELGAQLSDQVIYPNTAVDDKGEALTGERKYVLHFDAGKLPPVSVFWNMAMYGSDMLFVENDFGRYSIGSTTDGLKTECRRLADDPDPEGPPRRHLELAAGAGRPVQPDDALLRARDARPRRIISAAGGQARRRLMNTGVGPNEANGKGRTECQVWTSSPGSSSSSSWRPSSRSSWRSG